MAKKNDNLVEQLLKKVEEKKEQIKKIKNPQFKTNLSFPLFEQPTTRLNLNVVGDDVLFPLLVNIESMMSRATEIANKHDLVYDGMWSGFPLQEWYDDIILKIRQHQSQRQVIELREIESKLNGLMSEEKKTNIELEKLSRLLAD